MVTVDFFLGLQPATFCNFYPSGFLGCGARRNVLTKPESGDEDLGEPGSPRYESVALTPDEKTVFNLEVFWLPPSVKCVFHGYF